MSPTDLCYPFIGRYMMSSMPYSLPPIMKLQFTAPITSSPHQRLSTENQNGKSNSSWGQGHLDKRGRNNTKSDEKGITWPMTHGNLWQMCIPPTLSKFNKQQQSTYKKRTWSKTSSAEPSACISSITMSNESLPIQVQVLVWDKQHTSQSPTPPSFYSFKVPASPSIIQQIIELTDEGNLPNSHITIIAQQAEQIKHAPTLAPLPHDATSGGEEDGEATGELQLPQSPSYHPQSLSPEVSDPHYYGFYLEHGPRPINEDNHPNWPWKHCQNLPFNASVPVRTQPGDDFGTSLKYTYLSIKNGIPTSISTEGQGQPIYLGQLRARDNNLCDYNESINITLQECPFSITSAMDPVINRALWSIPEAGIWADVHNFTYSEQKTSDKESYMKPKPESNI